MARMVYLTEFTFFSNRNVWHMIWGGVFERHPGLRYVITEQGFGNVLDGVRTQEYFYDMIHEEGSAARQLVGEAYVDELPLRPAEYLRRNCWFGASMLSSADAARRAVAGVARVMWGADYPHTEGTWPHSKDAMAAAVDGVPNREARQMLGLNAAEFYGFDLAVLQPVADRVGPLVAHVGAS
jgi:predicted TIM-barrel fold metal-dependent hydrolase